MKLVPSTKRLHILRDTMVALHRNSDESSRVNTVLKALRKIGVKDCLFTVNVLSNGGREVKMRYIQGKKGRTIRVSSKQSILSELMAYKSAVSFPLLIHDQSIGAFSAVFSEKRAFRDRQMSSLWPFIYLLAQALDIEIVHPKVDLATLFSNIRAKRVLVLGKDTNPEFALLRKIARILKRLKYQPILVKDYLDIQELSNEEKVRLFADASQFVILENSYPAGQIAELKMCATNRILTAAIRKRGKGSSFMVTDYFKDFDFIKEFEYTGANLPKVLRSATGWAEAKIKERSAYYDNLYPWRKKATVT